MSLARLRPWSVAASVLAYALLAHYSNVQHDAALGASLAAAPLLLSGWLIARRSARGRWLLAGVSLATLAGLLACWPLIEQHFTLLYLLQQTGVYAVLAAGFGRSLLPGEQPLCTRFADMVHGPLAQEVQQYTRAVTAAWAAFFVLIALAGVLLYLFAPLTLWSLYSNFLTLPLTIGMFLGEYAWRHRHLSSAKHYGLIATARAVMHANRHRSTLQP